MEAVFTQSASNPSTSNDCWLLWALVCSILLHLAFALIVPNFKFDTAKTTYQELKIELVKPETPEPLPVVVPEPPKSIEPSPIEEPKKAEPKPVTPTPIKKSAVKKMDTSAVIEPPTETITEPISAPPEVISVAPKADVQPAVVVPAPETPKATGSSEGDINAARNAFRNQAQKEVSKNRRYPKIAQQRSIQGTVSLEIYIDQDGNVSNVSVVETSGNDALDRAAVDAVNRSNLKQYMQDILRGRIEKINVTLDFKLVEN